MNAVLTLESPAPIVAKGTAVRLQRVSKTFAAADGSADEGHIALHALDATFAPGRVTGLVGPDGSGKTTLMRMIAGLLIPSSASLARLDQAEQLLGLAESQYEHGQSDMTDVLDARRMREAQLSAALEAKERVLLDFVTLHKSLGGDPTSSPGDARLASAGWSQ